MWGGRLSGASGHTMAVTARRLSLRPARETSVGERAMGARSRFVYSERGGLYERDVRPAGGILRVSPRPTLEPPAGG